jgi:REP element-mobilizing transposase RayT
MSTGYKIQDQEGAYYITLQVVSWVDVFTRQIYRDIIIDNLRFCQKNKSLSIFAYVLMSNHIHMLVQSEKGTLSDTLREFKSYTSKVILDTIYTGNESRKEWLSIEFEIAASKHKRNSLYRTQEPRTKTGIAQKQAVTSQYVRLINSLYIYQFWTHENHAGHIYTDNFLRQKLDYIHMNPVRAGIVRRPEEYVYSSATNYAGLASIMDVEILTTRWKTYS